MSEYNLGKLVRIELRDIWMSESSHFTPWLAREEIGVNSHAAIDEFLKRPLASHAGR